MYVCVHMFATEKSRGEGERDQMFNEFNALLLLFCKYIYSVRNHLELM